MLLPFTSLHHKYDLVLNTFACRVRVIKISLIIFRPLTNLKKCIQCAATQLRISSSTPSTTILKCASIFIMQHLPLGAVLTPFSSVQITKAGKIHFITVQYIFSITRFSPYIFVCLSYFLHLTYISSSE